MKQYTRLKITAEGKTEREFIEKTLSKHLIGYNVLVQSRCVMTSKNQHKEFRGGLRSYEKVKKDIQN